MPDLKDLKIYQMSTQIRRSTWKLAKFFPAEEKYRLSDQLIRSTRKCPANIAEGYGRYHWQENIQYCRIARGSLLETIDHLDVALECGYISEKQRDTSASSVLLLVKMLNNYINYLRSQKNLG